MRTLIVDDEPLARELLASYAAKIDSLEVMGFCTNALEAFSILNKQPIDLLFLDINMPEISGIALVKALKNPPRTIFTTAYAQFAVESYELNAVDYLLKPITFDRFLKAVQKATDLDRTTQVQTLHANGKINPDTILFIKSDGRMIKVDLREVWFVEGLKNYITLWTANGKVIVHSTMKNMEDQLKNLPYFLRINKSYIANLNFVTEVDGNMMRVKGEGLVIGSTYRDEVHKILDRYKLM